MKKLKKILLINWLYFSKELIEVGDINFLTGKNGAGKSTVIDALQIVLLGETNSRNFNQAANEKSQRTLEGYLRCTVFYQGENGARWTVICAPTWMITARIPAVVRTFLPILSANFRMRWRAAAL